MAEHVHELDASQLLQDFLRPSQGPLPLPLSCKCSLIPTAPIGQAGKSKEGGDMHKYPVGSKVKIIDALGNARPFIGTIGEVKRQRRETDGTLIYDVYTPDRAMSWVCREYELVALEKTLDNLEVGDIVLDEDGDKYKVLEVGASGKTVLLSHYRDRDEANEWFTIAELKKKDFKVSPADQPAETVDILGKTYKRSDVEDRLKELESL